MGRSQDTFNKREQEKKRIKKKLDKEKKKEERKANIVKNKSFEDMLAYVDENGNISSTPPEENDKKNVIKIEDIQLGAAKRDEINPEDLIRKGTIKYFNEAKGYGFIKDHDSQESVFVHINSMTEPLKENDKVTFETERGQKGLSAVNVKLLKL